MNYSNVIITTERLQLIPTSQKFKNNIFKEFTADIAQYMEPQPFNSLDEVELSIDKFVQGMQKGECLALDVLIKETGDFIGRTFLVDIKTNTPELGIWLIKSAHGNKYAKEIIQSLYQWSLENIEFTYLKYPVDKRNVISRKVIESVGGKIEKEDTMKNQLGKFFDIFEYRICKN